MRFSRVCTALSGTIAALALAGAASAVQVNLIPNGDFEAGNVGFGSDYANAPAANTVEGQYTVTTNPYPWNINFALAGDHGDGAGGNMLVGNGTPTDARAWYTEISVASDTHYSFEAFVMNVCCNPNYGTAKQPVAGLVFYANGVEIASRTPSSIGLWEDVTGSWFSGESTSLLLELRSTNFERSGNDFAVDDIALYGAGSNTPEPGTLALTGLGAILLAAHARRRSG